jgi:hypothetical protein
MKVNIYDRFYNFIMYTPVLLTIMIIVVMPRYNWNIVEGGIKHYNPNPKGEMIHRMYRNHDYFWGWFGSRYVEAAYDTNDMMLIFWKKK